jgi:WD40 repeat protein
METQEPEKTSSRRYAVFLSYRHADNKESGRQWATWLHQALEGYEIPADLVGTKNNKGEPIPASLYPVFRDEEELPADADLTRNIRQALENSGLLVVLCSPRAVESRFVADEIRYFKELGKSDRILALMIDGEPNASDDPGKVKLGIMPESECLPEPLRYGVVGNDGKIDWNQRTEPIAADVRPEGMAEGGWTTGARYREALHKAGGLGEKETTQKVREYERRLELAKLKVVAGALGVPLGVLTKRDKAMQLEKARQRARTLRRWLVAVGMLAILAIVMGAFAWKKKQEAERNAADALTDSAIGRMDRGETFGAMQDIASAIYEVRDQHAQQVPNLVRLRFMQQTVPQLLAILPHDMTVASARLSPDGSKLVTTEWKGKVRLWDIARITRGESLQPKVLAEGFEEGDEHDSPFQARFSSDGTILIAATAEKELRIWKAIDATQISVIPLPTFPAHSELSVDGEKLVTAGVLPEFADVWETRSGKHLFRLSPADVVNVQGYRSFDEAVFDQSGQCIATTGPGELSIIWDTKTGKKKRILNDDYGVLYPAFRPNTTQIATSTANGGVTLWDFESGLKIQSFSGFADLVNFTTFDRSGERLLALSQSDNPRLWSPEGKRPNSAVVLGLRARPSQGPGGGFPIRAEFSNDGSGVLTWQANTVTLWDVITGRPIWTIQGHVGGEMTGHVTDASMSSDGQFVATASSDKTVRIWRVPHAFDSCIERYDVKAIRAAGGYSDERGWQAIPAVGSFSKLVRSHISWTKADGEPASADCLESAKKMPAEEHIPDERTSPDGSLKIDVGKDYISLDVVETKTGKIISSLKGHQNAIHGAHFDQSGNLIASYSSGDNTARVWLREKNGQFSPAGVFQQVGVRATEFNQSSSLLAIATYDDNSVSVWDIASRKLITRIIGSNGPMSFCNFDSQGRLVTGFSKGNRTTSDGRLDPIPNDRVLSIWDTKLDIDANLVRTWVEVYTGTRWAPNIPGGVDGLTEAEWNERRHVLQDEGADGLTIQNN